MIHREGGLEVAGWNQFVELAVIHREGGLEDSRELRDFGSWVPWAWPHDGLQHDKGSGEQLAEQYRRYGLNLMAERATWPDGTNGVEAGLMEMLTRMEEGRWKVFEDCDYWLEERRMYHREKGKVVKLKDDLMCLHPDTQVITDCGMRPIRELVGNAGKVLSINGVWAEFRNCRMTRQDAQLVQVHFDDGSSLLCTPDHKLLTTSGDWVEAADSTGIECHNAISHCISGGAATWKKSGLMENGSPALATKVLRVDEAGSSDVYCMEVPATHAFAIGNGAVVHNCSSRYALMMLRFATTRPRANNRSKPDWRA